MDRETYRQEVRSARRQGDQERMDELKRMEAEGRIGDDADDGSVSTEEAYRREVKRAADRDNQERMDELKRMEAEGRIEDAAATSGDFSSRLSAEIDQAKDAGNDDLARRLESIREAGDPTEALDNALRSAVGDDYDTLQSLRSDL
jgi:hypothetical protein